MRGEIEAAVSKGEVVVRLNDDRMLGADWYEFELHIGLAVAPPESPEPPGARVTLTSPYPESYAGAPRDKLAVQYAVIEIAKQAGLRYNWDESYRNTDPVCRQWVKPHVVNLPWQQALSQILDPVGLTYELRGDEIILKRR